MKGENENPIANILYQHAEASQREIVAYFMKNKLAKISLSHPSVNEIVRLTKQLYRNNNYPSENELLRAAKVTVYTYVCFTHCLVNHCHLGKCHFDLIRNILTHPIDSLEQYDQDIHAFADKIIKHPSFEYLPPVQRKDIFQFAPWLKNIWDHLFPNALNYNVNLAMDRMRRFYLALRREAEKFLPLEQHRIQLGLDGKEFSKSSLIKEEHFEKIAAHRELKKRGIRGKKRYDVLLQLFPYYRVSDDRMRKIFERLDKLADEQGIQITNDDLPANFDKRLREVLK